jgi:mannosyltransferase OCH1-like enzyme
VLWADSECLEFIRAEFPELLGVYEDARFAVTRVNIFRLAVLYRYGGVYADLDMVCLRPIEELLEAIGGDHGRCHSDVITQINAPQYPHRRPEWQAAFIIAKAKSAFLLSILDQLKRDFANRSEHSAPVNDLWTR